MRTRNRYKFTLTASLLDEIIFSQQVYPQFSDLNIKYTKEADQVYYMPSFGSKLSFVDEEFDLIVGQDLRAKFSLSMQDTYYIFSTKQMSFMRTDCEIDVNHKLVTVTPKLFNPYKKFIDKRDEEYSVVDMGLNKKTLITHLWPQTQVYVQDDNKIQVFGLYGRGAQPQVTPSHSHEDLHDNMRFECNVIAGAISFTSLDEKKVFVLRPSSFNNSVTTRWGTWQCAYFGLVGAGTQSPIGVYFGYKADSQASSFTGSMRFAPLLEWIYQVDAQGPVGPIPFPQLGDIIDNLYANVGGDGVNYRFWPIYTGTAIPEPFDDFVMPDDDITKSFSNNYKTRAYSPPQTNTVYNNIVVSTRTSTTPTIYGRVGNSNLFYNTPDDDNVYIPMKRESWVDGASLWTKPINVSTSFANTYAIEKSVADFYSLYDVINGMLQKIAPEVVFLHDTTHSQFLFSQINPVTGVSQLEKYMTQKSNVLKLDYDYPAWKAPLKWSQLEELLKNAFNCYTELFYDDSDNAWHLRIEHVKYYMNGHSYDDNEDNGSVVDLIQAFDGFNRESLSFRTNRWKYDTESQADRYEFGWMDTQTEVFDGKPLIVTSEYSLYEDAKKEECKVSWFDTDIDFAMSVTSEISSDGFMLVSAQSDDFIEFINTSAQVNNPGMQNYSLSFEYLVPSFHLYNKYAEKMVIEGTTVLLDVAVRKKMRIAEDIQFKVPKNEEVFPSYLVKTEAGFAEIDDITIDMTDNSCTATLRYNTL